MPRLSLAGFTDPARRPRYVIWTGVGFLLLIIVMVLALGITSSRWFCATGCHKVQDDTILAYSHSSHDQIQCMSCHMPVDSGPVTFMLHKMEALGELFLTVTNRYELPLNPDSELALDKVKMPERQCTQCHNMKTRRISPSRGIVIDHAVHAENGISCTHCHNRVAHKEDFTPTLPSNRKHEDFMKMQACFRCHGLQTGAKAPGACSACHPKDFELKPANHLELGFYPKGHAKLGKADPKYCSMCHVVDKFCSDCHGLPMPHPKDFIKTHGSLGKSKPQTCVRCHGTKAGGTEFCNACHHKGGDPNKPWIPQHFEVVKQKGAASCLEQCHRSTFCAQCHVRGLSGPSR